MINIETPTYYTATKKYNLSFPTLESDIDADVVVIGGGFSGINTALELAEKGITNIVVLEARYLGFGGTGRNGGQIMAGIGHDLEKIKASVGEQGLREIFEISELGAGIIKERIARYAIDADFCHGYGYMGFNARQEKTLRAWEKDFKAINQKDEIRFLGGSEVKQIIGSDAYSSALLHMGVATCIRSTCCSAKPRHWWGMAHASSNTARHWKCSTASALPCAPAAVRSRPASCCGPVTASSTSSSLNCTPRPSTPTPSR